MNVATMNTKIHFYYQSAPHCSVSVKHAMWECRTVSGTTNVPHGILKKFGGNITSDSPNIIRPVCCEIEYDPIWERVIIKLISN